MSFIRFRYNNNVCMIPGFGEIGVELHCKFGLIELMFFLANA
jgi:hypothetical protein